MNSSRLSPSKYSISVLSIAESQDSILMRMVVSSGNNCSKPVSYKSRDLVVLKTSAS